MKSLFFSIALLSLFVLGACKREPCEVCTYTGINANGDAVNQSLDEDCSAPGKEINRSKCQDKAATLTNGQCNCVES